MAFEHLIFSTALMIILIIVGKIINQIFMHVNLSELLIHRENPAVGIELSGYFLGVSFIIAGTMNIPQALPLNTKIMFALINGVGGILALALICRYGIRLILSGKCMQAILDGNVAVGIVSAGFYIAISKIIVGLFSSTVHGNWLYCLIFLISSLLAFFIITLIFRQLTSYNDVAEIYDENIPAALSYAGSMIAVSLIVERSVGSNFIDYYTSFASFGKAILFVVGIYPIRQWLVQGLLLGGGFSLYGGSLDKEISQDKSIGAGIVEAVAYIASAMIAVNLI
ncbi:MAG: DUF350 domain-containing protein [Candidatus Kapabacteria bacterium]|nr:DUF350 domain-containing protein [Candidatus Kapabacteria bacterium]